MVVKLNERKGIILIGGASCNLKRHLTPLKQMEVARDNLAYSIYAS